MKISLNLRRKISALYIWIARNVNLNIELLHDIKFASRFAKKGFVYRSNRNKELVPSEINVKLHRIRYVDVVFVENYQRLKEKLIAIAPSLRNAEFFDGELTSFGEDIGTFGYKQIFTIVKHVKGKNRQYGPLLHRLYSKKLSKEIFSIEGRIAKISNSMFVLTYDVLLEKSIQGKIDELLHKEHKQEIVFNSLIRPHKGFRAYGKGDPKQFAVDSFIDGIEKNVKDTISEYIDGELINSTTLESIPKIFIYTIESMANDSAVTIDKLISMYEDYFSYYNVSSRLDKFVNQELVYCPIRRSYNRSVSANLFIDHNAVVAKMIEEKEKLDNNEDRIDMYLYYLKFEGMEEMLLPHVVLSLVKDSELALSRNKIRLGKHRWFLPFKYIDIRKQLQLANILHNKLLNLERLSNELRDDKIMTSYWLDRLIKFRTPENGSKSVTNLKAYYLSTMLNNLDSVIKQTKLSFEWHWQNSNISNTMLLFYIQWVLFLLTVISTVSAVVSIIVSWDQLKTEFPTLLGWF